MSLRHLVSKKKRRFIKDGFDLDLVYITERIITMGYPSTSFESTFRNPLRQVQRFFSFYHPNKYFIYNMCSEPNRQYDSAIFDGRVAFFGFDDHHPPPLALIGNFTLHALHFLSMDDDNVVAIHCKAGKGRAGTASCCLNLLLAYVHHQELQFCFDDLLFRNIICEYGKKKTTDGKGISIPSQMRYIYYFERLIRLNEHAIVGEGYSDVLFPIFPALKVFALHSIMISGCPIDGVTVVITSFRSFIQVSDVHGAPFSSKTSGATQDTSRSLLKDRTPTSSAGSSNKTIPPRMVTSLSPRKVAKDYAPKGLGRQEEELSSAQQSTRLRPSNLTQTQVCGPSADASCMLPAPFIPPRDEDPTALKMQSPELLARHHSHMQHVEAVPPLPDNLAHVERDSYCETPSTLPLRILARRVSAEDPSNDAQEGITRSSVVRDRNHTTALDTFSVLGHCEVSKHRRRKPLVTEFIEDLVSFNVYADLYGTSNAYISAIAPPRLFPLSAAEFFFRPLPIDTGSSQRIINGFNTSKNGALRYFNLSDLKCRTATEFIDTTDDEEAIIQKSTDQMLQDNITDDQLRTNAKENNTKEITTVEAPLPLPHTPSSRLKLGKTKNTNGKTSHASLPNKRRENQSEYPPMQQSYQDPSARMQQAANDGSIHSGCGDSASPEPDIQRKGESIILPSITELSATMGSETPVQSVPGTARDQKRSLDDYQCDLKDYVEHTLTQNVRLCDEVYIEIYLPRKQRKIGGIHLNTAFIEEHVALAQGSLSRRFRWSESAENIDDMFKLKEWSYFNIELQLDYLGTEQP